MIIVNIRVPALEKVYNVSVEEKVQIGDLIEEIALLVYQKEGFSFEGDPHIAFHEMCLCSVDVGIQFNRQNSLANYGICDGAELILM